MGVFSESELFVISELSSEISTLLFTLHSQENDKAKLVYSLCANESAKNQYTKERIEELTKEIKNSDPAVAGYIACIKKEDTHYDINELIESFLSQEFQEEIEKLASENTIDEDYHNLPELYNINPFAEKQITSFVSSAHNVMTLNSYIGMHNSNELDYREKIINFLQEKIIFEVYSNIVSNYDEEKNYYKYALTLKQSQNEIDVIHQEQVSKLLSFKKKYEKYSIRGNITGFDYRDSFDYEKFIEENLNDQLLSILKSPASLEIILDDNNYQRHVPEIKNTDFEDKIKSFADYVYCHYVLDILIFLSELPYDNTKIEEVSDKINLELLKIENYVKGIYNEYFFFDFNKEFSKLFYLATQPENAKFNIEYYSDFYWRILQQIAFFADKGMFENEEVYKNGYFHRVLTDIELLVSFRIEEFAFFDKSRFEEEKPLSIKDLNPETNFVGHSDKGFKNRDYSFETSFTTEKQLYILQLLEDLGITHNGQSTISERKKSALRGIAEGLISQSISPPISLEKCYRLIAEKIGLQINSKLDFTNTSQEFKKKTEQYIKNNPPI